MKKMQILAIGFVLTISFNLFNLRLSEVEGATAPSLDEMGDSHHSITTKYDLAQDYFDRGLISSLWFQSCMGCAFFQIALDPKCAMCNWGLAYAEAMERVVRQYPEDLDAATIYPEALIDTMPWNYWTEAREAKYSKSAGYFRVSS